MVLQTLFWFIIFLIGYSIFGYPVSLKIIQILKRPQFDFNKDYIPSVTLLISTYNEAKILEEKINNSLAIDYPNLNILIISDGSTDNTVEICKKYSDKLQLIHYEVNEGKNASINKTLAKVTSEIIVFSDANTFYQVDTIKNLVFRLSDPKIGCVIGQLRLTQTDSSNTSQGEGLYWKYEHMLKSLESQIGHVLVGNGGIFSAKRKLINTLQNDIPNDFQVPMDVGYQGYNVLYEPEAVAKEKTSASTTEEMKRKIRIVNRNFTGFIRKLSKIKGIRLYEIIFHKVIRWLTGILATLLLILNLFLISNPFYFLIFIVQLMFYGLATVGFVTHKKNKLIFIPMYITLIFYSATVGILHFLAGRKYAKWKPPETSR